ncbi:unnamed protein product, partial [Prorocentrum cordatum]
AFWAGPPRRHASLGPPPMGSAAVSGTMASSPGSVSVEPRVAQPTSESLSRRASAPSTSSSARLSPACSTVSRLAARPAAAAAALAAAGGPFIGGPRLPDRRNMSRSFYIACSCPCSAWRRSEPTVGCREGCSGESSPSQNG